MTDPKEVERLMDALIDVTIKLAQEGDPHFEDGEGNCYTCRNEQEQKRLKQAILATREAWMIEGARVALEASFAFDPYDPESLPKQAALSVRAHLSKPAPEAGECRGCELAKLGADMSAASHTCTPAPKPEAGECHACHWEKQLSHAVTPHTCKAPAVCEACAWERQNGRPIAAVNGKFHTCKPSGA